MQRHVLRDARDRYGIDDTLRLGDPNQASRVARRMTAAGGVRPAAGAAGDAGAVTPPSASPADLAAAGLIDEILRHVARSYRDDRNPAVLDGALAAIRERLGPPGVDATLQAFADIYPDPTLYRGEDDPSGWLEGSTEGVSNRQLALEELLLIWVTNANPALAPYGALYDDATLADRSEYEQTVAALAAYFATQPPFGPDDQSLLAMLRAPAIAVPESLSGQLRYMRERWSDLLGELEGRLARGLDVLDEEALARWRRFHPTDGGGGGAGHGAGDRALEPVPGPAELAGLGSAPEHYSTDREWMPRLVLLAKSTYVWLDQLSRQYGREIRTLDAIPDEELDRLARYGVSGLWLIGLWERSKASQTIKQLRGNPDAVASAYSLDDYRIADDLGGEAAHASLRDRAGARGIRLASDMVPNHMGIDSRWVMEHPDRFLSLDDPPYPGYTFDGPDLSSNPGVGIFLEDHYYDNSDAAVVFRRLDRGSGEERFVYHGNDGTSMPWNDTAQLDYSRADVREAVIETIVAVARRFPVIRFDAAMTLARKHVERLWFPAPGAGGGAIPSRASHGMTKAEFDAAMPAEFWRQVVDRVAAEVPDTLLLAEAFWMMEGYFVRSLGMHRVYNSAFMHMLRDEKNAEYRALIRDTLEFDPEILKRYVNFMNNPDERTAVDQFGKGDKYFGVATLMATLPGLPMIGHGQLEGYAEKYGMEYRRAYLDESPDPWLVGRHERELVPLLHRRGLFAQVRDFAFFDVMTDDGSVAEDIFAFSNRIGADRALVLYHNRYGSAAGWIRESAPFAVRNDDGSRLERRSLADALGLAPDAAWVVLRDAVSGLEYLRSASELRERGLRVALDAYGRQVFTSIREVADPAGRHARLAERLGSGGVPSIDEALWEQGLAPIHEALAAALDPEVLGSARRGELDAWTARSGDFLRAVQEASGSPTADPTETLAVLRRAATLAGVPDSSLGAGLTREDRWATLAALTLVRTAAGDRPISALRDELRLGQPLAAALRRIGLDEGQAWWVAELLDVPERVRTLVRGAGPLAALLAACRQDPTFGRFIGSNWYEGVSWFGREPFGTLAWWAGVMVALEPGDTVAGEDLRAALLAAAERSGYRLDRLAAPPMTPAAAPKPAIGPPQSARKPSSTSARRRRKP
ncbi:MAG: alpha-amylase family glycosyl hydrolase [Chloroflexota bacterium]